jgi:molecular chaperone HscB
MNKAFTTLSNPIDRGLYLLKLNQIDYKMESNIQSKQEDADKQKILVDILELNELIDEITETRQVEELEAKLNEIILPFEKQLKASFERNDFENAVEILSKMKYYQNVTERLEDLKLKFDIINF